jgi:hypothetical protein
VLTALTIIALAAAAEPTPSARPAHETPSSQATPAVLASIDAVAAQPPAVAIQPTRPAVCPPSSAVEAALVARVAGVVVAFDRAAERRALRLTLVPLPANAGAEMTLTSTDGRVRLRRQLTRAGIASKRADQSDCDALAETAALMVERYLAELDQPHVDLAALGPPVPVVPVSPPPPEPPPLWSLGVGNQYLVGDLGRAAFDMGLRLTRTLGQGRSAFLYFRAGAGLSFDPLQGQSRDAYQGTARLRRFPAELGVGWRRQGSRVEPQVSLAAASDLTWVRALGEDREESSRMLAAPQAVLEAAVQVALTQRAYLRLSAAAVGQLVRYEFFTTHPSDPRDEPVFALPARRVQARLSLEVGFSL